MRNPLTIFFLASAVTGLAQSIASLNLNFWYDPARTEDFKMSVVRSRDSLLTYYKVDTSLFRVRWERRESYSQRSGDVLNLPTKPAGQFSFQLPAEPWLLVATLTSKGTGESFLYFKQMENNYPVDGFVQSTQGAVVFKPYLVAGTRCHFETAWSPTLTVYFYGASFQSASPPFAEKEVKVDPVLSADSTFRIESGKAFTFEKEGLYLVQSDTASSRGVAFRVVNSSFPKLTRMGDLPPPLVFICTKEEFARLRDAGDDKIKFDEVILEITREKERARNFMRNYFRRVELANALFTTYKEGWKTDRGMIYMIFGLPDEVNRAADNEVWYYRNVKARFSFVRTGSVYGPDNYALVRDNRFTDTWYYTIDMWRKGWVSSTQKR